MMIVREEDILELLSPPELAEKSGVWQKRQSIHTRTWIIETSIQCLAHQGYAKTTLQLICEKTGISRGGLQHHYESHLDLMASVADYAFFKRMQRLLEKIVSAPESEREALSLDLIWDSLLTIEYDALLELNVAARSDAELFAMLEPKIARYDEIWNKTMFRLYPAWSDKSELFQISKDFFQICLDGYAIGSKFWKSEKRRRAMKTIVRSFMLQMRESGLELDSL